MTKTRYFVSDIREDLLMDSLENKAMIDTFGRYFITEAKADAFIKDNPNNSKYIIHTEGRKIIRLVKDTHAQ